MTDGDRVLDVGCGCGTNGIFAWQRSGPEGFIAFVDSNVRALALAEHTARPTASSPAASWPQQGGRLDRTQLRRRPGQSPLLPNSSIARMFIGATRKLCSSRKGLYMVTKQLNEMARAGRGTFGMVQSVMRRGYTILCAWSREFLENESLEAMMVIMFNESEKVEIPSWVTDLASFRRWAHSDDFPESCPACFLEGEVWLDISKEQLFTHAGVKGEFVRVLRALEKTEKQGHLFPNGILVSCVAADFSCQPDTVCFL